MMLVLSEIMELLAERYDEVTLLELLDINSEELVERFSDKIEQRYEKLQQELDEEVYE
jgi:hypothetical protein